MNSARFLSVRSRSAWCVVCAAACVALACACQASKPENPRKSLPPASNSTAAPENVQIISQDEADRRAAAQINASNADAEMAKLKKELDQNP
jgi:hypothetical protein